MRWLQQDTIYLRGTTEKIKTYRVVQCTLVKGGDQREPGEPEPLEPAWPAACQGLGTQRRPRGISIEVVQI